MKTFKVTYMILGKLTTVEVKASTNIQAIGKLWATLNRRERFALKIVGVKMYAKFNHLG